MKLTCEKKSFEEAILASARAINSRSPLPILSHFLIEASNDQLKITATDLDVGLSIIIEADIIEAGAITCPARLLNEIVSKLPAGKVSIATLNDGRINLSCGSAKFELSALPAEEFPSLPEIEENYSICLPQSSFKNSIKQVAIAAASSQDESRTVMTGILLKINNNLLTLVATDGRRLACNQQPLNSIGAVEEDLNVIIPARALIELSRLLDSDEPITMSVGKSLALFSFGRLTVHCRLLEGHFPDYTKVIPTSFLYSCRLGRDDFLAGIRRMLVVAQEKKSPGLIKLRFTQDKLYLSANTPDLGSGEEFFPVVFSGEELVIGFNGKYLIDGLTVIDSDEVQFDLQEDSKSAVLRVLEDNSYRYVIMPIKLRDFSEELSDRSDYA